MSKASRKRYFMRLCPGCGRMLYYRAQINDMRYGTPFQHCQDCGAEYQDSRFLEPALVRNPKLNRLPLSIVGGLLMGAAFLLGALYLERKLEMVLLGGLFFGSSAYFALTFFRSAQTRKLEFEEELKRSHQRLQDPAYVQKLRDGGIKVPDTAISAE